LKLTIAKIAEMTGVSKTTVSRVLNNSGYVSSTNRSKITAIIDKYGYVPDSRAISLSKTRTETIGLVIPETSGPFYAELLSGVEESLRDHEHFTLIMTFGNDKPHRVRQRYLSIMRQKRVDGMIIFDPELEITTAREASALGIPVVFLGKDFPDLPLHSICVDNFRGAVLMMEHLMRHHNYRRIAFITGPSDSQDSLERFRGYKHSLETVGIGFDDELVFRGDFTRQGAQRLYNQIIKTDADVVFASNDEMALGIIESAHDESSLNRFLPVVGYDDAIWSQFIEPPLTTIRQPMYQLGRLAGHTITETIAGKNADSVRLTLNTHLVVRRSCGC